MSPLWLQKPCIQLIARPPGARKPSIWSLAAASYSTGMADDMLFYFINQQFSSALSIPQASKPIIPLGR
jgi:hypothetical protein